MDNNGIIDSLMEFGLTRQEATIYIELHKSKGLSGYEVAKNTGISRSNAYSSLSGLVDKGAATLSEGDTTKYYAVNIQEFSSNKLRHMAQIKESLIASMPNYVEDVEGYLTIKGDSNIFNKIITMLQSAKLRVYISMTAAYVQEIRSSIEELIKKGIKVIIITDKPIEIEGAKVYLSKDKEHQIGIITDSVNVLSGEYKKNPDNTALYTGQPNFVRVFKESLKNEIELIKINRED